MIDEPGRPKDARGCEHGTAPSCRFAAQVREPANENVFRPVINPRTQCGGFGRLLWGCEFSSTVIQ